jgi:hypothetical protein
MDDHVCEWWSPPKKVSAVMISNPLKAQAYKVDGSGTETAVGAAVDVPVTSAPRATELTLAGTMTVESTWAGNNILIRLVGEVKDEECDNHGALDPALNMKSYMAELKVPKLKDIVLQEGPAYAPPRGTSVNGASFEVEKGDTITLKAVIEPEDAGPFEVEWAGEGTSGNSVTQTIKYDGSTGQKPVSATYQGDTVATTVCVNNNASAPISNVAVDPDPRGRWAHVKTENLVLTASATDYDWIAGLFEDKVDKIDLDATQWKASSGKLDDNVGAKTKWTPAEKGEATVTATFHDYADVDYAPRDDPSVQKSITVGGFKVLVALDVSGSGKITHSSTIAEDGKKTGDKLPAQFKSLDIDDKVIAKLKPNGPDSVTVEGPEDGSRDINIKWTYKTDPVEAVPRGKISAKLETALTGEMRSRCWDNDIWEGVTEITWAIGLELGKLGFDIGSTIKLADASESAATITYGFDSNDLGQKNPRLAVLDNASSLGGGDDGSIKTKAMSYDEPPRVIRKFKDQVSGARYQSFLYLKAYEARTWYHAGFWSGAEGGVKGSRVTVNYSQVAYEP